MHAASSLSSWKAHSAALLQQAMLFWPLRPSHGAELTFVLVVLSPCLYMHTMYTTEPLITGL